MTSSNLAPLSANDFKLFQDLLIKESGLYFTEDKINLLSGCLGERLKEKGLSSYKDYYDLLRSSCAGNLELNALFRLLTVGETYFFRNPAQFDALRNFIIPEIIKKRSLGRPSIKIWSAGCSTGEEPYSIAIYLLETLPNPLNWDIYLLATDINEEVLNKARDAVYGDKAVRNPPEEYVHKYFIKKQDRFILREEVKKMVEFARHNLAKDPFILCGQENLDIIFCRNVTIYFDLNTTKKVIGGFYKSLVDGGYLFLGEAETLWQIFDQFRVIDFPRTFIYRKEVPLLRKALGVFFIDLPEFAFEETLPLKSAKTATKARPKEALSKVSTVEDTSPIGNLHQEATNLFKEKRYDEALVILNKIIASKPDFLPAHFMKANLLANEAKYEEAIDELKKIIDIDNLFIEAHYLLGALFYKKGNLREAISEFREVCYINPHIVLAYYNLGNIYLSLKQYQEAKREFQNTLKLLEGKPKDELVTFSDTITVDLLARACNKNLEKIKLL